MFTLASRRMYTAVIITTVSSLGKKRKKMPASYGHVLEVRGAVSVYNCPIVAQAFGYSRVKPGFRDY